MNRNFLKLARYAGSAVALIGCATTRAGVLVNNPSLDTGDVSTQSEPSVARMDTLVVVGFNDSGAFATANSFTGYSYSYDSGDSFVDAGVLAPVAGGSNSGDPSLAIWGGNFYFATLASDNTGASFIGVARSLTTSPTVTFSAPVLIGGLDPNGFQDKELIAADTTGSAFDGNIYVVWTEFLFAGGTQILFSRSVNGGVTYSAPVRISAAGTAPTGATPFVGPNGVLHVAWEDFSGVRIRFRSSNDGGLTWGTEVTVANLTTLRNAGATATCGRAALNGDIRTNEFPTMAVDMSAGPNRGDIYISYAADPNNNQNTGDAADVFFVRSTNGGTTWSAPVSVHGATATNGDTTQGDNFMPSLAVDGSGAIGVSFYDRRGDAGNLTTRLFRATSSDGGATWSNQAVSSPFDIPRLSPNFDPAVARCYMGDYNGSAGQTAGFATTWGDNGLTLVTPAFPAGRADPDVRFLR